jgi:hypothetical protein
MLIVLSHEEPNPVKCIVGLGGVHTAANITAFELFLTTKVSPWFIIGTTVRCWVSLVRSA